MIEQVTWLIWRALHTPPADLDQLRDLVPRNDIPITRRFTLKPKIIALALLILTVGLICVVWMVSIDWLMVTLTSALVIALAGIIGLMLASGTINGVRWAFRVAMLVYRDIHEGRFELMSLSPLGTLGAIWAMTHQRTRINHVVAFFQTVSLALFLAMVMVGLAFIFTLLQGPPTIFLSQPILGSVLTIGYVILLFYLDYVQAVVVGHLSGIFIASIAPSLTIAQVATTLTVIAIQVATYLMAGMVAILGAIAATFLFSRTGDASLLLIALAFVSTAYVFREVAIRALWRAILMKFAVTTVEFTDFHQAIT